MRKALVIGPNRIGLAPPNVFKGSEGNFIGAQISRCRRTKVKEVKVKTARTIPKFSVNNSAIAFFPISLFFYRIGVLEALG